jgi:hypothetical protein
MIAWNKRADGGGGAEQIAYEQYRAAQVRIDMTLETVHRQVVDINCSVVHKNKLFSIVRNTFVTTRGGEYLMEVCPKISAARKETLRSE